ncbi:uncharacterized protein LOC115977112 [Quercus lobata]|uniref:uncharacterized protein LOC115977112 n=1 Tax=Quercus lobata TaxID=97700 RepID=UPI001247FE14|nr:uncharacterized protein LOC115977112 [Quercus lobata]
MAYVLAHDVVLYRTKDIILAHLVFSFHGCSFICFMKFITPQDNNIQLIQVCTLEFARSALRFSFHSKWMSAVFFHFTAFIGFLAMVNFDLMKNLPNTAGEVADNIAVIV